MIKIAIVGFGIVGRSFAELLLRKRETLAKRIGEFEVVLVADSKSAMYGEFDLREAIEIKKKSGRLKYDAKAVELLQELDYDVLVECTPTRIDGGEGVEHMRIALSSGAHVVTSNKSIVAAFRELEELAEKKGVRLMYEATVGAAIPVIRTIRGYLSTFTITGLAGVLNGTCNYILTRMEDEGLSYEHVLREAIELGIAEADPSYDVEGIDAAIKLVILANTIGIDARFEDVERRGISFLTPEAFKAASEKGYTIRLVAEAGDSLSVRPRLVRKGHPLATRGTMNVIVLHTEEAGSISLAGRGAGGVETASAMLSDLVAIYDSSR
ncbi:MAG: homoserine dehydrogenase [Archaeoglobaceae archaeon]